MNQRLMTITLIDCMAAMPCGGGRFPRAFITNVEKAKKTPDTAVIAELIATASIFQRKLLMPSARAASSSSRIACQ